MVFVMLNLDSNCRIVPPQNLDFLTVSVEGQCLCLFLKSVVVQKRPETHHFAVSSIT